MCNMKNRICSRLLPYLFLLSLTLSGCRLPVETVGDLILNQIADDM